MRRLPLVLAVALLAGCPAGPPARVLPSAGTTFVAPPASVVGTVVTGAVLAPANLVGQDGATLVGNDGASIVASGKLNLVGNDGASMVAAGGGNYALAQIKERRIAGVPVYLADAGGNPIPGLAPVTSDAAGRYTFRGVPAGYAFQVVAKARLADGRDARLTTLVRSTELGATAPIGAETTIATAAVLSGLQGPLGAYGEATYARIVEVARKAQPADWTRLEAVSQEVARLQATTNELRTLVGTMREEIEQLRQNVATLEAAVVAAAKATPAPTPSPTPTATPEATPTPLLSAEPTADPSAEPTADPSAQPAATPGPNGVIAATLPRDLRPGWRFDQASLFAPGRWLLASASRAGDPRPLTWTRMPDAPGGTGYQDLGALDAASVSGDLQAMTVTPGNLRMAVIGWRAPGAGRLTWRFDATSETTVDGVGVQITRYAIGPATSASLGQGTVRQDLPLSLRGAFEITADEAISFAFDKGVTREGDACGVTIDLRYEPAAAP